MRLSRTITAPTARRGHVERVATSCAMRIKYSSHEGRAFFSASCAWVAPTCGSSKGSIKPVARVAEARDYERSFVEFRVNGGRVECDVRGGAGSRFDAPPGRARAGRR